MPWPIVPLPMTSTRRIEAASTGETVASLMSSSLLELLERAVVARPLDALAEPLDVRRRELGGRARRRRGRGRCGRPDRFCGDLGLDGRGGGSLDLCRVGRLLGGVVAAREHHDGGAREERDPE